MLDFRLKLIIVDSMQIKTICTAGRRPADRVRLPKFHSPAGTPALQIANSNLIVFSSFLCDAFGGMRNFVVNPHFAFLSFLIRPRRLLLRGLGRRNARQNYLLLCVFIKIAQHLFLLHSLRHKHVNYGRQQRCIFSR